MDVRDPATEVGATVTLPGAKRVVGGMDAILNDAAQMPCRVDDELLLVCDHGVRSARCAAHLHAQGYAKVSNLEGGVEAWRAAGLPVVGVDGGGVDGGVDGEEASGRGRRRQSQDFSLDADTDSQVAVEGSVQGSVAEVKPPRSVKPSEALLQEVTSLGVQVLDVSGKPSKYGEKRKHFRIDPSSEADLDALLKDSVALSVDLRKPILVVCQTGTRSRKAAEHLANEGFSQV